MTCQRMSLLWSETYTRIPCCWYSKQRTDSCVYHNVQKEITRSQDLSIKGEIEILVEFNKGDLKIADDFDPMETFNSATNSEHYWSGLLLSLRLMPGKDRRTKILALRKRKPVRPKQIRRKTRSVSPAKSKRSSVTKKPPTGLNAGDSISSVESMDSMGSGGSMSSGASFDFRIHSLQKAKSSPPPTPRCLDNVCVNMAPTVCVRLRVNVSVKLD